jgi:uncharacterized membrane protein YadS
MKTLIHYEEKKIAMTTCNSLYFYIVSVLDKLHELQELQLTVYMVQLIAIQLQINYNSIEKAHLQLLCTSITTTTIMSC